jgi:hypothetical protein
VSIPLLLLQQQLKPFSLLNPVLLQLTSWLLQAVALGEAGIMVLTTSMEAQVVAQVVIAHPQGLLVEAHLQNQVFLCRPELPIQLPLAQGELLRQVQR